MSWGLRLRSWPAGFLSGLRLAPAEPRWRLGIRSICVSGFPVSAALALRDAADGVSKNENIKLGRD